MARKELGVAASGATDLPTKGYVDSSTQKRYATPFAVTGGVGGTSPTAAVVGGSYLLDGRYGAITLNLPTGALLGDEVFAKMAYQNTGTYSVNVAAQGTDTIDQSVYWETINDYARYISDGAGHWYVYPSSYGMSASGLANTLVRRDSAGRAQVANPAVAADIANKSYADSCVYFEEFTYTPPTLTGGAFKALIGNTSIAKLPAAVASAYNTSTGIWTAPIAGVYQFSCGATTPVLADGARFLLSAAQAVASSTEYARHDWNVGSASFPVSAQLCFTKYCAAGTALTFQAYCSAGITMASAPANNHMSFVLLGQ